MRLYYFPGACSLAPHIAACEAGLAFDIEKVDLKEKKTETGGDYTAINHKGAVPALKLDNGEVLTEVAVLLQYIAAQAPASGLMPADGMARWRQLELINFVASELHKSFGPLFNPALPADAKPAFLDLIKLRLSYLEGVLGSKPYLAGDRFTAVDAYAFTIINWTKWVQIDLAPWPGLVAYMERVGARPGVQRALKEEGLL